MKTSPTNRATDRGQRRREGGAALDPAAACSVGKRISINVRRGESGFSRTDPPSGKPDVAEVGLGQGRQNGSQRNLAANRLEPIAGTFGGPEWEALQETIRRLRSGE